MTPVRPDDSLITLRRYRDLAPWNLRDLAAVAGAMLKASGVRPTNAAASAHPSERTIRYYVTRGLVSPPDGRGTAATYTYRHLLEVLLIKLRQMEGASLERLSREVAGITGDTVERRVAAALGTGLPSPNLLAIRGASSARGRAGQAMHVWSAAPAEEAHRFNATKWHRIPVARGVELHVHDGHPLATQIARRGDIANAVRLAINGVVADAGRGDAP
jgi:hypothetical protein